jgi:hypothetical protein
MKLENGLYVQVNEKLPGGALSGIFLSDTSTEGTKAIYYAKSGVIRPEGETNVLLLLDGELQQRDLTNNQISIVTLLVLRTGHGRIRACRDRAPRAAQGAVDSLSPQSRRRRSTIPRRHRST